MTSHAHLVMAASNLGLEWVGPLKPCRQVLLLGFLSPWWLGPFRLFRNLWLHHHWTSSALSKAGLNSTGFHWSLALGLVSVWDRCLRPLLHSGSFCTRPRSIVALWSGVLRNDPTTSSASGWAYRPKTWLWRSTSCGRNWGLWNERSIASFIWSRLVVVSLEGALLVLRLNWTFIPRWPSQTEATAILHLLLPPWNPNRFLWVVELEIWWLCRSRHRLVDRCLWLGRNVRSLLVTSGIGCCKRFVVLDVGHLGGIVCLIPLECG